MIVVVRVDAESYVAGDDDRENDHQDDLQLAVGLANQSMLPTLSVGSSSSRAGSAALVMPDLPSRVIACFRSIGSQHTFLGRMSQSKTASNDYSNQEDGRR